MFLAEKERRWGGFFFHVITKNCTAHENSGSQSAGHGTAAPAAPESLLERTTWHKAYAEEQILECYLLKKKVSDYWIVDI